MTPSLLKINNLSLKIGNLERPILSNINYEINPGEFIIILGSNGSGKSSLLKLLENRYYPTEGEIFLEERLLSRYSEKQLSQQIKTLTQNCHESLFTSLTIFENYLLRTKKPDKEFLKNYLKKFNINLSLKLDQIVEKLSGGEKQALALALIMLYPPKILLLDEHTSALDPHASSQIMQLTKDIVEEYKITCILTTHDLFIAENYGDRILALKNGSIHQDIKKNPKAKLSHSELLNACY
jgi:putative ABC transport system ATP-binding protein